MQSSERNTRSTRKFVPDPAASPGPESQSDTGQYLCIECSETFDTRLELSLHRQSHVTKKQFTCGHCGRGFHHQVFLQMHERSHEDPAVKSPPGRVISTRSSKMADVVHVRPTYTKPPPPPRLLNSIVEFKNDPKACQAFAPRECVTRRGHAAPSPHQRDGPETKNLFELRISKFSDTTVHLLDSFGNSIEILADVFNTYTIGEAEGGGESVGEASTRTEEEAPSRNDSGQMSPQRLPEVPSASSRPNDPPPPSHEPVTDDAAGLPVPALPDLEGAEPPEEEEMEDQTKTASDEEPSPQENVNHDPPIQPVYGEDHMDTSPEAGPQEVQDQPGAPLGQPAEPSSTLMVEQPIGGKDSRDENSAIAALPVQPPGTSKAPPPLDDPGADPSAPETDEEHKLPDDSTLPELDAEAGHVDSPKQRPGDPSSAGPGDVSPYSPPLESRVQGQPGEEEAELCDTSSMDEVFLPPEDESIDGRSTKEPGAEHEEPASGEGSGRIGVHVGIPEKRDLPSASVQEKKLEAEICMTSQEVGDVSISEGEEIDLQVDSKDPEERCNLSAEEEVLPGEELVIDDKREEDLFERDMFPLEAGEKGLASIGAGQNIVCGGEAHRAKRVQEKDSDICLNGSDMTYISESEMIKLLEQDKDDITDDEPTSTSQEDLENASQEVGFGAFSEPKLESELSNHHGTKSSRSPGIWNGERNTADGTGELPAGLEEDSAEVEHYPSKLKATDQVHNSSDVSTFQPAPEEKMDTDPCLPGSLLTIEEPRTGEPQNSMLTQDSEKSPKEQLAFPKTSSSSRFQPITRNSDAAQPERGLSCGDQSYEPHGTSSGNQDVPPVGDSTLSRTEDAQENVTPEEEEDSDVCVTVEDNDGDDNAVQKVHPLGSSSLEPVHEKPQPGIPDYKGLLSATEPARVGEKMSSPQKEVREPKPLPELHTQTEDTVCTQERTLVLAGQEMENLPLDALNYMQSTSNDDVDDDDDHTNASSERTDVKNEGIRHKPVSQDAGFLKNQDKHVDDDAETREQTTDPSSGSDRFSKTLSTTENDESKENDPKGTPSNELAELPTANADLEGLEDNSVLEDLEKQSVPSPKTVPEDLVSEVTGDDHGSATKQVSDVISAVRRPVFRDNAPESLEDSELMEDDHQEDETPTKAMGAGGACLKCGRKLRRSRKELVWLPVCFKCRKAAKKLERLSAHEVADGLDLEPLVSRREEGLSADVSGSHIKEDGDGLQEHISSKPNERDASGSAAPKMYKCPKCDKAFRIPALLAGHIKCHTLPQCLSCGCQMQLKYKTKRIPRRCQKCFQQLKEKMRAEKKGGEGSGDEDSGSSDEDAADSLVDVNPDDDDDDEISEEDSHVAVPKAKRKPFKAAKPGPRDPTEQIHDDVLLLSESPEGHPGKTPRADVDSFRKGKKQEIESSDELDASDLGLPDGEKPRLCPQCGKAFPCNRSLNLHLLSHSGIQCESCGCRLPKRRRVGRWSKKCRGCRLQMKGKLLNDSGDESAPSGNKSAKQKNVASVRLKAKQSKMTKNTKIQSMIKKKKELKWLNMLLAVKGLMDKSRKKKENALKAADAAKKDGESSEAEKGDSSSVDNTSILPDHPDMEKAGSSKLPSPPNKAPSATPKQGRKCLYRDKNIIKVEENEALPYLPGSAASISTAFIKKEESWQCLECNQSWPNSEALVNHQHSHITGQSLTCPQCPQVFSSEQYLNIHVPAHEEDRPFRCTECDKTFSKRNHLGVHMRVHSGSRPYACPDCPCRFRQKVTLIAHRYSHRNYQLLFTKPFQCSVCSKSFKQKERLVVHERLHTGECPFSCKDCDEVFPSKARLYVHRKTHKIGEVSSSGEQTSSGKEVSGGQPFKCQDCGKVCSTKASFVLHRKVHRLSSTPVKSIKREQNEEVHPFSCTDCNKVFSSKATLTVHLKNHSAHKATARSEMSLDPKEGFPCKHCDKVCSTKASLALHRKVHKSPSAGEQNLDIKVESDTPSYTCKDCNKVCSTKASFALHRKVHKTPETPPFRCKDCDMVCTTKASFVLHRKVHRSSPSTQQSPTGDAEPQLYNCKHCDMVCSTKSSFVLHSKVHKSPSIGEQNLKEAEGPQSYNCKHCDMVCSTKASFILHSKVHRPPAGQGLKSEEEPQLYTCKHCDMVCSTKASFALHSKVHRALFGSEQSPKTSEGSLSYSCKHCDMVCSTKASFVLHSRVHRSIIGEQSPKAPEEPQSYKCKECDLVCSTKDSFVLHLKVHRSEADAEENPFACNDCSKVCSTKASFVLHRRVHKSSGSELGLGAKGGGAESPFHCKDCGKFFTSKGRLAAHRRLHDGSSGHDQNSENESDAKQPKKTSEEKPFPCTICGRRFIKLKMLVRHKAVHGERTVTPCMHCGKQFLYMKSLFNHIKICQSKGKGKKQRLLKKAAAKRKLPKDAGSAGSDGESAQKKRKIEEKQKAQKLKNKSLTVKAKKAAPGKERGKGKAAGEPKTKEKRAKVDGEVASEGEGKKTATEKQSDGRQEKPSEQAAKEPTPKKNLPKIKKAKKEPAKSKQKVGGGQKKWRVLAASRVKKKNLQAVLIGGKKKLLMKKKVQLKAKSGGKASKDGGKASKDGGKASKDGGKASKDGGKASKDGGKASKD